MKYPFIPLILLVAISCQHSGKSDSASQEHSNPALDSLVYEQLQARFDLKFEEIEKEYESASETRKLQLNAIYEHTELEMVEAQKKFIKTHPDYQQNIAILWEIDWSFHSAGEYRSYLDLIDVSQHKRNDYLGLEALIDRMEQVEIGKVAPDFEMNDAEGRPVRLSKLYITTKYLLVDFWASNCAPCRIENATIRKAYDLFQGQGFNVLGVSTDVQKESWMAAIETDGLIWTNVCSLEKWNENEVVETYALRQVSQNFLLDHSGEIIAKDLRGEELIQTLQDLYK